MKERTEEEKKKDGEMFRTLSGGKDVRSHREQFLYLYNAYRHRAISHVEFICMDAGRELSESLDYDGAEGVALGGASKTSDFVFVRQTASALCADLVSIACISKETLEEDKEEIYATCERLLGPSTLPGFGSSHQFFHGDKFATLVKYEQVIKRTCQDDPARVSFLCFSFVLDARGQNKTKQ